MTDFLSLNNTLLTLFQAMLKVVYPLLLPTLLREDPLFAKKVNAIIESIPQFPKARRIVPEY